MWATQLGIKRYFYVQALTFRAICIDITSVENAFKRPILTGVLIACGISLNFSWAHYAWIHRQNLNECTEALVTLCQGLIFTAKICVFFFKHKQILNLTQYVWLMARSANKIERKIIADENKFDRFFATIYLLSILLCFIFAVVIPHFIGVTYLLITGRMQFFCPMVISQPFDLSNPIYYTLIAAWMMISCYAAGLCSITIDTLYSWLVHNIAAQFRIVNLQLEVATSKANAITMVLDLHRCIRQHQQVISLSEIFESIFRPIIFVEFTLNGFQVCFLLYLLRRGVSSQNALYLVIFLFVIMFQLLIYSYGGQHIENESERVALYAYECIPWQYSSSSCKQLLAVLMLRAQKCCQLSGFFFVANWKLFVWVTSKAFSYFTLLLSFAEE